MEQKKVMVSFSGGKDAILSLYRIQKSSKYEVAGLFTTVQAESRRTALHGVREQVLDRQARALGLPLKKVYLSENSTNKEYEAVMTKALMEIKAQRVEGMVYGDIFLEDIRRYRENHMEQIGMETLFPLWGEDTSQVIHEFLNLGFQTVITTLDKELLPERLLGKEVDELLVETISNVADPCGENGEFHTIVIDGPIFQNKVGIHPVDTFVQYERYLTLDFQ